MDGDYDMDGEDEQFDSLIRMKKVPDFGFYNDFDDDFDEDTL